MEDEHLESLSQSLVFQLSAVGGYATGRLEAVLPDGLNIMHLAMLVVISEVKVESPVELAKYLNIELVQADDLIDLLAADGYIEVSCDSAQPGRYGITLTKTGEQLLGDIAKKAEEIDQYFTSVYRPQTILFGRYLSQIFENIKLQSQAQ